MGTKQISYLILLLFAFIAEMIDGVMGMGYGVSLTSLLLSLGLGTAMASATVHVSEIFTTFASGISHFRFGNFDKKIFAYLVVPGVFGGSFGAYCAVRFQDLSFVKPFISGILLLLGLLIIYKYVRSDASLAQQYITPRRGILILIGLVAAFVDAVGGGGWGPISTPALVMNNAQPRKAIGSVNFAEFFVTVAISVTFFIAMPHVEWHIVVPMIIGGVIAAPIAALITNKLPHKALGIAVGCLIAVLSLRIILRAVGVGFLF